MRYTSNLRCRHRGIPHDLKIIYENQHHKIEKCQICGKRFKWNKGYKGRTNNQEYLKAHIRNFAQPGGATKRIYEKIYNQHKMIIKL